MTEATKRRTSRPVPTKLHELLIKACPADGKQQGSIRRTLSPALGISYQLIYRWINNDKLPAKYVKPLVKVSGGSVTQEELLTFVL